MFQFNSINSKQADHDHCKKLLAHTKIIWQIQMQFNRQTTSKIYCLSLFKYCLDNNYVIKTLIDCDSELDIIHQKACIQLWLDNLPSQTLLDFKLTTRSPKVNNIPSSVHNLSWLKQQQQQHAGNIISLLLVLEMHRRHFVDDMMKWTSL